jgi:mono/diheme cytochrome c family protein
MRLPAAPGLKSRTRKAAAIAGLGLTAVALMAQYGGSGDPWWEAGGGRSMPMFSTFPDGSGDITIVNMDGPIATRNHPFFEDIGPNGRACITCHQPSNAMGLATSQLRQQWKDSQGRDPVFAAIDGSNCPTLPQRERSSHSLLLNRGVFRIYLPLPAHAEFKVEVVRDPTGCNTDPNFGLHSAHPAISVFRRPRMVGNLKYVVASDSAFQVGAHAEAALAADGRDRTLEQQAAEAMHAHEQAGRALTKAEIQQILDFESQVYVAQSSDNTGGDLTEVDGPLGAWSLGYGKLAREGSHQPVFLEASYWKSATASNAGRTPRNEFRESVARGNALFSGRTFQIAGVAGLNHGAEPVTGTCATCHDAPNAGSNLSQRAMDVGTTVLASPDAVADLPVFKLTCDKTAAPHPTGGRVLYTTDPGRALTTGKCADVGSIVMQQFRGLSARAPYFSNGSAKTLWDVVEFYDTRFAMKLSEADKQDLVNFLSVL